MSQNLRVANSLAAFGESTFSGGIASRAGYQVVKDFYLHAILMGMGFQVRAGTVTTPLVGDVVITDTAAEYCVDAPSGTMLLPTYNNIAVRLATGTLFEFAIKSVATASSAGTAFTPLPLRPFNSGGGTPTAAVCTARVAAAGGVTVTAELATTTRRHWAWSNPVAAGAGNVVSVPDWVPGKNSTPVALNGPWCLYVQIAATTTGPSYYASMDWIEAPTASLI